MGRDVGVYNTGTNSFFFRYHASSLLGSVVPLISFL